MRKTDEEPHKKRRERFEIHAVRLANLLEFAKVEQYEQLPNAVRRHLEGLTYCQLVVQLMERDHYQGATYGELARRYSLPKTTVWEYLNAKRPVLEK